MASPKKRDDDVTRHVKRMRRGKLLVASMATAGLAAIGSGGVLVATASSAAATASPCPASSHTVQTCLYPNGDGTFSQVGDTTKISVQGSEGDQTASDQISCTKLDASVGDVYYTGVELVPSENGGLNQPISGGPVACDGSVVIDTSNGGKDSGIHIEYVVFYSDTVTPPPPSCKSDSDGSSEAYYSNLEWNSKSSYGAALAAAKPGDSIKLTGTVTVPAGCTTDAFDALYLQPQGTTKLVDQQPLSHSTATYGAGTHQVLLTVTLPTSGTGEGQLCGEQKIQPDSGTGAYLADFRNGDYGSRKFPNGFSGLITVDFGPCEQPPPTKEDFTVSVNTLSCEAAVPGATVVTKVTSSIGYKLDGSNTVVWLEHEVPAGTYHLALPSVGLGHSLKATIVIQPLDDRAGPFDFGPYTWTRPNNCGVTPTATPTQTVTPSPSPSSTPTSSPSPSPTQSTTPIATPTSSHSPTAGPKVVTDYVSSASSGSDSGITRGIALIVAGCVLLAGVCIRFVLQAIG